MDFKKKFVASLNGMALGLFSSLLIGLIIKQIGSICKLDILVDFGQISQLLMGPAIGVSVAYSLGASPLCIFSSAVVGAIGAGTIDLGDMSIQVGEPVGAYIATIVSISAVNLLSRESSFKIIWIPLVTIISGGLAGIYISPIMSEIMKFLGDVINRTTELNPLPMGLLISLLMGMLLTLPISSAAISMSLGLSGLAAGASVVGCCCQMIGFAVISYKDNGFGGFLAQALGTSMLQISNIVKNPKIWIPSLVSSIILGPISTLIFRMENDMFGAGMGSSGLVGQISAIRVMGFSMTTLIQVFIMHFIGPGLLSYIIYRYLYSKGKIKDGDMKI